MTCQDLQRDLIDYAAGDLNDVRSQRIRLHLSGCQGCRDEARSIQETLSLASAYRVPPLSQAGGVRMLVGVRDRVSPSNRPRVFRWVPAMGSAVAAVLVAFLVTERWQRVSDSPPIGGTGPASLSGVAEPAASATEDPQVFGAILERLDRLDSGRDTFPGGNPVRAATPSPGASIIGGSPALDAGSLMQEYQEQHLRGGRTESLLKDLSDEEFDRVLQKVEENLSV